MLLLYNSLEKVIQKFLFKKDSQSLSFSYVFRFVVFTFLDRSMEVTELLHVPLSLAALQKAITTPTAMA